MHHLGITLHLHEASHFHGAELGNLAYVIAAQVHQHGVFGLFLRVLEKVAFQLFVLRFGQAAFGGTGNRLGGDDALCHVDEHLRGGADDFVIFELKIIEVGGGVGGTQATVHVERIRRVRDLQPAGEDHLENIALFDVFLRPADVFQMLLLGDVRLYDGSWVVVRHMGEGREFCEIGSQALCF